MNNYTMNENIYLFLCMLSNIFKCVSILFVSIFDVSFSKICLVSKSE